MRCEVGGVGTKVLVDSGSVINTVTEEDWERIRENGNYFDAYTTVDLKARAYASGSCLNFIAKFKANIFVSYNIPNIVEEFYVVRGAAQGLLSSATSKRLGILRIGINISSISQDITLFPKVPNYVVKFIIDKNVAPRRGAYFRVPYALENLVDEKLLEMEKMGIIERVYGFCEWVSPLVVVPKGKNDVRICVDMRGPNGAIKREYYPLPTLEDFMVALSGSKIFSKVDSKSAYHHFEIDEESRELTTFLTKNGLYRFTRLMFGVNSAPEIFQREMDRILGNLKGVKCFIDDILIFGKTQQEHDENLKNLLNKLKENNFKMNDEKCEYSKSSIDFLGHSIDENGLKASLSKVESIQSFRRPETLSEMKSFLGLLTFLSRFIRDMATKTEPFKLMLRQNKLDWSEENISLFEKLKTEVSNLPTLGFFDKTCKTVLYTDASPVGLGCVLTQIRPDGKEVIIAFGAKTLTETERRYPQTQREAYAAVWAVERYYFYLYGTKFTLKTDYRALSFIYKKDVQNKRAISRAESWALRLQCFDFDIVSIRGVDNIADSFSRLAVNQIEHFEEDHKVYLNNVEFEEMKFITEEDIIKETEKDDEIQSVINAMESNNWSGIDIVYRSMRKELQFDSGILFKDYQVVLPTSLRLKAINMAHSSHAGIVVTKRILREKVWWPRMGFQVEKLIKHCPSCQLIGRKKNPLPLVMKNTPVNVWTEIAIDHLDLAEFGKALCVIDYTSRYLFVRRMTEITTDKTVAQLMDIFSVWYFPKKMRNDNAKCFDCEKFKKFALDHGISIVWSPPRNPESNGEVERINATILKSMRAARLEKKSASVALQNFLMNYNSTLHSVTLRSPFEFMTQRKPRMMIEQLRERPWSEDEALERNKIEKLKTKLYADKRRQAREDDIEVGDKVVALNLNRSSSKLEPTYGTTVYDVIEKYRNEVVVENNGHTYRKAINHVKKWHSPSTS